MRIEKAKGAPLMRRLIIITRIQCLESGIQGVESGIQGLESRIQGVESTIQDCLGLPYS